MFMGRSKDGRVVDYFCFGAKADFESMKLAFSVDEYTELVMWKMELSRLLLDGLSAIEGKAISSLTFHDVSGGSLGTLLGVMECGLRWRLGDCFLHIDEGNGGEDVASM